MIAEENISARLRALGLNDAAVDWMLTAAGERIAEKLEGDGWLTIKAPRWDVLKANTSAFADEFYRLAPHLPAAPEPGAIAAAAAEPAKLAQIFARATAKEVGEADVEAGRDAALAIVIGAAVSEAIATGEGGAITLRGAAYDFAHAQPKAGGRAVARLRDPNAGGAEEAEAEGEAQEA